MNIGSIILIGIALSMDTFSLSLGVGTFLKGRKRALMLASSVAIMHFLMPFFGMIIGNQLIQLLEIKCDMILGIILIFIAIQMILEIVKEKEQDFYFSFLGIFLFAFGVSLDSFTVGLGLKVITDHIFLSLSIFSICSFIFTYLGLFLGRFANRFLGIYANILGIGILFLLGIFHLL